MPPRVFNLIAVINPMTVHLPQDMPECRVIPYFKGFLTELKEILSVGGPSSGGMLGDLSDFLRANTCATCPPSTTATAASTNYITPTTGNSVNNNNPSPNSSSSALGSFAAALHSSTVNSSSAHQNVGFSSGYMNSNISNNNNVSGTMNKNLLSGDSNCVKPGNSVGPSKGESTGDMADSITRGMQTVNVATTAAVRSSPQDQRHTQKNSQQKVVSL